MSLARWKDLCIDASRPAVLGPFWARVLGLEVETQDNGDLAMRDPGRDRPERTIWVNGVPEPRTGKNRVHLDLVLPSVDPLAELGATVVGEQQSALHRWTVLDDPEGGSFCVFPGEPGEPTALVVDAADPVSLAAWWADVLEAEAMSAPDGAPRWLKVDGLPWDVWKFVAVPEPKAVKNRWHWDVACDDVAALVERGATLLRRPDDDIHWHVLADPEGNEFCVFSSS
jgi:hypothetical protein